MCVCVSYSQLHCWCKFRVTAQISRGIFCTINSVNESRIWLIGFSYEDIALLFFNWHWRIWACVVAKTWGIMQVNEKEMTRICGVLCFRNGMITYNVDKCYWIMVLKWVFQMHKWEVRCHPVGAGCLTDPSDFDNWINGLWIRPLGPDSAPTAAMSKLSLTSGDRTGPLNLFFSHIIHHFH